MPKARTDTDRIEISYEEPNVSQERSEANRIFFTNYSSEQVSYLNRSSMEISPIMHGNFRDMLDKMRLVIRTKGSSKPTGLLILGNSDSGKSTLLQDFRKKLEQEENERCPPVVSLGDEDEAGLEDLSPKPAFLFSIPSGLTAKGMIISALSSNGILVEKNKTLNELENFLYEKLRILKTRVILIDEFHDISGAPTKNQDEVLKILKEMTNNLSVPIIAAGTHAALSLVNPDEQLRTRFSVEQLKPFKYDANFRDFLATYELKIMKEQLNLSMTFDDNAFINYILTYSDGWVGQVIDILRRACDHAIRTKTNRITNELLKQLNLKPLQLSLSNNDGNFKVP